MDMNRRNVLIGLGTAAAGSSMAFGSGAFTQVEADRALSIDVDGDASAAVELNASGDVDGVDNDGGSGDALQINEEELNEDSTVTFGDFDTDPDEVSTAAFTIVLEGTSDTDLGEDSEVDLEVSGGGLSDDEEITVAVEDSAGDDFDETFDSFTATDGSEDTSVTFEGEGGGADDFELDVAVEFVTGDENIGEELTVTVTA